MPGWHRRTEELRTSGALNVVGIVQEQHPARARLYQQWQQLDMPTLVDSLNLLGVTVVPIHLLVNRDGMIQARARDPDVLMNFIENAGAAGKAPEASTPDLTAMRAAAKSAADFRHLGDAEFLTGDLSAAITAYEKATTLDATDSRAHFRWGVAQLRRDATNERQPTDFGGSLDALTRALSLEPGNYIWRRRIQQYGPRLDKPYPFYDWVETAIEDVQKRGEAPVALVARLTDSERVHPKGEPATPGERSHPDPDGKLPRDADRFVTVETALAPALLSKDAPVRLHLRFRPDARRDVHWNHEAGDLEVWLEGSDGVELAAAVQVAPRPPGVVESSELRSVEFELSLREDAKLDRSRSLRGFVVYSVCEGEGGTCRYLRQDLEIALPTSARPQ